MNGPVLRTMLCAAGLTTVVLKATTVGRFENSGDVGIPPKPGKVEFDAVRGEYRITGGGTKVWAAAGAFQFVWKDALRGYNPDGDVECAGAGTLPHRKARLMIQGPRTGRRLGGCGGARRRAHLTSLQYQADDSGNDRVNVTVAAAIGATAHNLLSATHPDTVLPRRSWAT